LNNWGAAGRATVQFPASTQSVVDIVSGARIPLRRAFPIGTRTMGSLNLICCKIQQLYSSVHSTSQPGFGSLAPLAYVKEWLHNCLSAQGLIISRAF
jgi:hypothetical protein